MEIWISLQATINGKFGFCYRQQSMGNLDFVTGNNQWEIWISLQNFPLIVAYQNPNSPLIVACNEIQISH
jgi:hypothetical protein